MTRTTARKGAAPVLGAGGRGIRPEPRASRYADTSRTTNPTRWSSSWFPPQQLRQLGGVHRQAAARRNQASGVAFRRLTLLMTFSVNKFRIFWSIAVGSILPI